MASISVYHRYVKHQYDFKWSERAKWLRLLGRFHVVFASEWTFPVTRGIGERSSLTLTVGAATTKRDLDDLIVAENARLAGNHGRVRAIVSGTAFWGAMPRGINWTLLPANPSADVPQLVVDFASVVVHMTRLLTDHTDVAYCWDFSMWKESPVPLEWFPYVIRRLRDERNPFKVKSMFFAPSTCSMYVYVSNDDNDHMITRFDQTSVDIAADEKFDLDDGFGEGAPAEMHDAYAVWCEETDRDPDAPVLTLAAPYNVMV